jgi:glycerol kinase
MVVWGFEIGDSEALLQAVRHLRFRRFCIKIIIQGIQKSEITDCDTGGCGMWDLMVISILNRYQHPHKAIDFASNREVLRLLKNVSQ